MNKSKAKGSAYELKLAKILSDRLAKEFKRVPLSGSLSYIKGDLWVPSDTASFEYCIEAKHYKELNFTNLLHAGSNDLYKFWDQCQREAEVMKKKPLVIFRFNRSKDYVIYSGDGPKFYQEICSQFAKFRIALLDDWIDWYNEQTTLNNKRTS